MVLSSKKKDESGKKTAAKKDSKTTAKKETKTTAAKKDTKTAAKKETKTSTAKKETKTTEKKETKTWHVSKTADGLQWQVKAEGAQKATKLFRTKAEAEEYVKGLQKNNSGSKVVSHKKDGKFQKKRSALRGRQTF